MKHDRIFMHNEVRLHARDSSALAVVVAYNSFRDSFALAVVIGNELVYTDMRKLNGSTRRLTSWCLNRESLAILYNFWIRKISFQEDGC